MKAVTSGVNPVALNLGIRKAARMISDEITKRAKVRIVLFGRFVGKIRIRLTHTNLFYAYYSL
jgi:hypothetical protein